MKRICPICGRMFERRGTAQNRRALVCCSVACKAASQVGRIIQGFNQKPKLGPIRTCKTCGKTFQQPPSRLAKYCSVSCRAADSASFDAIRAGRHYNWKGGITPAMVVLRRSPQALAWTLAVFRRDGFRCRWCGIGGALQAHHIRPWALFPSLRFEIGNGITLCRRCHNTLHKLGRRLTDRINERLSVYDHSS